MDVYQRRRLVALSAIAAVFVVIVLMIRSCGGDDEEPVATTPLAGTTGLGGATSQSQDAYVQQGDDICLQANTVIAAIDSSDPLSAAAEEASAVEGELQSFQTLLPPDDGQEELAKFTAAVQELYELLQDRVTAIENEDEGAQAELETQVADAEAQVAKTAKRFGFESCGDPEAVGESSSSGETEESSTEESTDSTDTTAPPATTPITPETTPVVPPTDTGTEGGVGTVPPDTAPPTDSGGTDPSGGVSP